jgi:hypothetical protein
VAGLLAEFSPLGAPLTPPTTLSSDATPVVTFGGFVPDPKNNNVALVDLAFDQSGSLWVLGGDASGTLFDINPNLTSPVPSYSNGQYAGHVAIDPSASGNIWVGGSNGLSEFQSDGTQLLQNVNGSNGTIDSGGYFLNNYLSFDANGNLWGMGSAGNGSTLLQLNTTDGTVAYDAFPTGGYSSLRSLAPDGNGNVYTCGDAGGQTLGLFNSSTAPKTFPVSNARVCSSQLLLDGAGNLFSVSSPALFATATAIDEFTPAGTAISPAAGYTGSSSGETPTLNNDPNVSGTPVPGYGAAIDASGNLWVLNLDTNGSSPGNVLVEFVGLAAPVTTPTSVATAGQSGQLGTRP